MSFLSQPLQQILIGPKRSFGEIESKAIKAITGYVTISENAVDAIEITQQPVQQGAAIADHAFKKPYSISIQMLFSDNLTQSLASVYRDLLTLQSTFAPFNVVTPKRTYYNMLLSTLGQTTDKKTENCLAINATFQQIIIVPIGVTTVPASQLKNRGSNQATQKKGPQQSFPLQVKNIITGGK